MMACPVLLISPLGFFSLHCRSRHWKMNFCSRKITWSFVRKTTILDNIKSRKYLSYIPFHDANIELDCLAVSLLFFFLVASGNAAYQRLLNHQPEWWTGGYGVFSFLSFVYRLCQSRSWCWIIGHHIGFFSICSAWFFSGIAVTEAELECTRNLFFFFFFLDFFYATALLFTSYCMSYFLYFHLACLVQSVLVGEVNVKGRIT